MLVWLASFWSTRSCGQTALGVQQHLLQMLTSDIRKSLEKLGDACTGFKIFKERFYRHPVALK